MSLERIILVPGSIELVSLKDRLNYQEVVDDFPNAEVRIVTNIPNHYDTYYSDSARNKAKDSIK